MAYSTTTWNSGDAITSDLLNKMEVGIDEAHRLVSTAITAVNQQANKNDTQDSRLSTIDSTLDQINTTLYGTSNNDGFAGNAAKGLKAYLELANTLGTDDSGNYTSSLLTRLTTSETNIGHITEEISLARKGQTSLRGKIDSIDTNIEAASGSIHAIEQIFDTVKVSPRGWGPYGSLKARLDDYENDIAEVRNAHESTVFERTGSNKYGTLDARFEDDEQRIKDIQTEINNAHESTAFNKTGNNKYGSLDARFEAIEDELVGQTNVTTRLDTIEDNVTSLVNNKVNKTDIAINLTTQEAGKVLDATQGRILRETIEAMDTAYKAADTALDGRLDAIDGGNALDTTNGTLAARVGALETTIDTASTGLSARMTQAENDIDALESDLNTATTGVKARITALETTVDTATTGLSDRMTAAESAISHAASGADNGGLTERLTVVEGDINTATTGIKARITALETTVDTTTTGLVDRVSSIEDDLDTASTGLKDRVTNLEGKDTIVINTPVSGSNYTNDRPNSIAVPTPSENADYLIADDDGKYFYWRYINNEWKQISGAGGSGNSSGAILAELPTVANGDPNIDYFIGSNVNGYIHYRFVAPAQGESNGHYIKILPTGLTSNISVNTVEIKTNESTANEWPAQGTTHVSGGLSAYALEDINQSTNLLEDFVAVRNARINATYEADGETLKTQTLQILDTNGNVMEYPIVGGSGGGSVYTVRIETTSPMSRSIPSNSTDPVTITAKVVMKQGQDLVNGAVAYGQIQYRENGTNTWFNGDRIEVEAAEASLKNTIQNNTYFTVDVTKYLQTDKTIQIRLAIEAHPESETESVMRYQTFTISKVNISIASEAFDYWSVKNSNFVFNYRCFGAGITKIVHFLLDGEDVVTPVTTTTNNVFLSQAIPMTGKENGMHQFQVYFVTNTGMESNKLNYFILYNTDSTREAPLIGAAAENTNIVDGDEIVVNYSVNTIGSEKTDTVEIELYTMDNNVKNSISTTTLTGVDNNILATPPYRTFNYPPLKKANPSDPNPDPITVYVKFTATHNGLSNSCVVEIQVRYLNTTYELQPETNNLLFSYSAYGRSNNDAGKSTFIYPYTKVNGTVVNFTTDFNNFNWATDGYVDGESLIIGGGATVDINVPIFNSKYNNINIEENENIDKITTNGRTIEIDYEVLSATNLNATIIDCMTTGANPKGFRVTPQNCYLLNSGSNIDIDETGFIKNEENVAAAYLNPGTRTHLTFVIEPVSTTLAADGTYHQSANIYINGEFANACPYNTVGNDFDNNATITIGSDTCLIKLYSIKLYNRGLTEAKVLHNYAVSPVATRDKIARLEDNDILNEFGKVDYEKARRKYTCLLLTGMGTVNGVAVPTMAPYKGYPSVVGRTKNNEPVGKTESGLLLTKPTDANENRYVVEFNLQDKLIDANNLYGYASSNNVQGTSSQKFPVKNLKVYLAKGDDTTELAFDTNETISVKKVYKYSINNAAKAAYQSVYPSAASLPKYITDCGESIATVVTNLDEVPTQTEVVELIEDYLNDNDQDVGAVYSTYSTGDELIIHPIIAYKKSKKVKYALRENGIEESTLCWKADYMSTDHANTFNANIANTLYSTDDRLSNRWTDQTQYAVYGIKCLLFQQNGNGTPEFVGDGCLNNDKGNHKTFGLETPGDENNDTMCQKWDFRNNTNSLLFFKHDGLFQIIDSKPAASSCLECIYPDEGDLSDAQAEYKAGHNGATDPTLDVNYNHFQILSSWLGNRANYWYETNSDTRAAKKQIFIDEFRNHFNFNHILIYYLFMEYTALCDNRVKNIHMRTDNAGEERIKVKNSNTYYFEGNNNPNSGPWTLAENLETRTMQEPIMDENGNYQFDQSGNMVLGNVNHVFVKDSVLDTIDWEQGEGHSNFAIWAPVLYDLDSCFGAENVGYLKVRYDADWNYSLYNKLQFAGFDSILWLQVEDCFQNELKTMAKTLYNRAVGLNYSTFYRQQIVDNLASLCPAITNQDMILKYDTPWTEGYLDYTKDPPEPNTEEYKYLQRGTRTAQKSTFMKQRSLFLASKYDGNEFKQDKITFRAGTLVNHDNAILTLTANQKLYHGVQFGDLNDVSKVTRRANKMYDAENDTWVDIPNGWVPEFVPCRVQNIGDMGNTDGLEIYGASVLNDIGDISKFHPYQIDVGNAVNLKKLIIGSTTTGFINTSTTGIGGINACALLEEINICNCKNLTSLQLTNNGFIKKVYATGSGLNTLALPRGGVLDTIAYGANTTDITIINQSRLTNFSYEDSVNNNYANVTRLWIENTPNVPVKEIITARLTERNSSDSGLRAGGLRIIGIDLDLGSDTTFLELLASDLVKGTKLTANGGHIEGSEDIPTISGKIHISSIRASLLTKLNEMYPDLVIYNRVDGNGTPIMDNVKVEYEVVYKNYDGTVLYTDHRLSDPVENFIDPAYDINPITNQPYIPIPQKPSDAQYIYKFGLWRNGAYRRFTGWLNETTNTMVTSTDTVTGNCELIAQYPAVSAEERTYTVTWHEEESDSGIDSTTVTYGTDLSNDTPPAVTYVKTSGNQTKVFKGWDKPVSIVTGDLDVYAKWETSTINSNTQNIVLENLNAADIAAIARINDATWKNNHLLPQLGNIINIQMGHEFDYDSGVNITQLVSLNNKLVLDGDDSSTGNIQIYNNITPLAINSDWTLAIDYKFLMDSTYFGRGNEFVLASCYQNANSSIQGFKLSLVKNNDSSKPYHEIQVTWGNAEPIVIDYAVVNPNYDNINNVEPYFKSYRNIVVLSHNKKQPNQLRVYYSLPNINNINANLSDNTGYGSNYGLSIIEDTKTWSSNTTISTPLILGGNYSGNTTSIEVGTITRRPAKGIIYWAKFWDIDLGSNTCLQLASWPHETIPFYFTGYSSNNEQIYPNALSFTAAQGVGDRQIFATRNGATDDDSLTGEAGWHYSIMRKFCQEHLYPGLPISYQSIIKQTEINSGAYIPNNNGYSIKTTQDYLFLSAYCEINGPHTTSGIINQEVGSWIGPWHWMVPADINNVFIIQSGSTLTKKTITDNTIYKYRFNGNYIKSTNNIYNLVADPTSLSLRYNNANVVLHSGDIWIALGTTDQNSPYYDIPEGTAFIYCTAEDIEDGESITREAASGSGGWRQASYWNLRTYNESATTTGETLFKYIKDTGEASPARQTQGATLTNGRVVCPGFTV